MIESLFVYTTLALIMIACGSVVARRKMSIYGHSVVYKSWTFMDCLRPEYIIPILAFTFVFGCRWNVGIDYPEYLYLYQHPDELNKEVLFSWITKTMSSQNLHFSTYFSLWAFLQISLVYYSLRKYRYLFPWIAFFLMFGFYFMSMMNIIRQQVATCIFMVAVQYIEEKKFYKYMACVLLAITIHKSAVLLVTFYPLFFWKQDLFPKIKLQLAIYVAARLLALAYAGVIMTYVEPLFSFFVDNIDGYEQYKLAILENEKLNSMSQFGRNTGYGVYINIFLALPVICYSTKMKKYFNSSFFNIAYSLFFIRIIAEILTGDSIILNRPFVYVFNFKFVIYAFFAYYCFKVRSYMTIAMGVGFVLVHVLLLGNLLLNGGVNTSKFLFFWQV